MTVQLGDIELTRLQGVEVDEGRNLVEHRLVGATGSVFQDLGRGSIRLILRGLLLGEVALEEIETLRSAHADGTPLRFSGDVAVGSEITEVLIEDFEVHQIPGYAFRYEFTLRVREWTEPPEAPGAALAAVDAEVAADGLGRVEEGVAIGGALDDPGALAALIDGNPDFLSRIDVGELAQAVLGALGGLDAMDFAHLASALTGVDVDKFVGLVEALAEADSLGDVLGILADEGIDLLEEITGIDLSEASALVQAFVGGPEFINKLQEVTDAAQALLDTIADFDPLAEVEPLAGGPS
ncbi:hypothetical protein PPSIR1_14710 [Plesiocystis pacifica SIR-1]|uniref:Uncharacterized protein n=1 Tax=Plesiocystis pacifica SIR-1 TaxID=391625 RepID=A6GIS2_9BACT|nr:hypothetical protein [Plesiocystis pacifica]EDM74217.1 hypothetical protein PPSIR1_14710 [Plesiocystis pacifica SIR-1]